MIEQIFIGSALIIATVVVEAVFIAVAVKGLNAVGGSLAKVSTVIRLASLLSALTLWLLAGISAAIWLWAGLFMLLGEFEFFVDALYFASVSATTLGYGDSLLSEQWKLLSGFIAANGLILFSLNTAFLFEALRRFDDASVRKETQ
jgi:hypothetical protein